MDVTVELKVHILFSRFSFLVGYICGLGLELSQLGGHHDFHPIYQFLCLSNESKAHSYLFPAVLRLERLVTNESGSSMMAANGGCA